MNPKQTETLRMRPKTVRFALWGISFLLMLPLLVIVLAPVLAWLMKILFIGLVFIGLISLYIITLIGNLLGFL